jgi:hypothetical protein
MYMNCAVVDITNKKQSKRDSQASAVTALTRYPELFVANLADINSCKVPETTDVIFDTPGKQVAYGDGDNASMKPSFGKGQCTAKPSKNAGGGTPASNSGGGSSGGGSSSGGSSSGQWTPSSNSGSSGGNSGQWTPPKTSTSKPDNCFDGQYHPACWGGQYRATKQVQEPAQQQSQQQVQQTEQDTSPSSTQSSTKNKPNTQVQQELDAYLASLPPSRLVRRDTAAAIDHAEKYEQQEDYSAQPSKHAHTKDCKHKAHGYPAGSHYHNAEDLDPYPEDGVDYSNKNLYRTQDSQYHEDPESAYTRVPRQKRWTAYDKRQAVTNKVAKSYRPGSDESAYYQQQDAAQAQAQAQAQAPAQSTTQRSNLDLQQKEASTDTPTQPSTQTSSQTANDPPTQKNYRDMTDQEKFDAFLRRMVELSTNMASLIKYAAASSLTPSIPYYPPASTYDRTESSTASTAQKEAAVRRHARRAVVYPGPAVGSISSPGDATDAEEGFKEWFPNLVQGLTTKRQLVDPVSSPASAASGDGVNFFDALLAGLWKALGDPFNLHGDDPATDPVPAPDSTDADAGPDSSDIPLVLGEPDFYSNDDFPDFDIPDLDGHYTFPPSIMAPELPAPELLPGYELGPDGVPVWVGEGPDPLASDAPSIVITIDPIPTSTDTNADVFPSDTVPTLDCVAPIPQVGFNSCLGGCNHTAEEIAAHDTYLQNFAAEQAAYEQCMQNQGLDGITPPAGLLHGDGESNATAPAQAEDASHRRPRPGMSHPLIPYPLPENFTGPYPSNDTNDSPGVSGGDAPFPLLNATTSANDTAPVELLPYANKTLGELVGEIMKDPAMLSPAIIDDSSSSPEASQEDSPSDAAPTQDTPPDSPPATSTPSNSSATNPLQEAADQAEQGVTIPTDPVSVTPNALESIADALPWLMGPGPVVVSPSDEPPVATGA